MPSNYVCLYVDNSNIFHAGQGVASNFIVEPKNKFRIYFRNFIELALSGRPLREVVWGGSIPPPSDAVWGYLKDMSIDPDLIPRAGGENETVDHLIQLRMHRHARKYRNDPGVMVVATGDGKGYYLEEGFLYDVEGFVNDGWGLEVMSWEHSCHKQLKAFAQSKGRFVSLDSYYENITFIQGGRVVRSL